MATKNGNENLDKMNQAIVWDYSKIMRLKNLNETLHLGSLKVKKTKQLWKTELMEFQIFQ